MSNPNQGGSVEVVVYQGEDPICTGTIAECAKILGCQPRTLYFYLMPEYRRRVARRKRSSGNIREVVRT